MAGQGPGGTDEDLSAFLFCVKLCTEPVTNKNMLLTVTLNLRKKLHELQIDAGHGARWLGWWR